MDKLQGLLYLHCILLAFLLLPDAASGGRATPAAGFSFRLIHRDSAESPLRPHGNLTAEELGRRLARYTAARLLLLKSALHPAAPLDAGIRLRVLQDSWQFYVQLGIGTPPIRINLLIDTGSDLIWTQSKPCNPCFAQREPIYNASLSSSDVDAACADPLCTRRRFRCINNKCVYNQSYADATYSSGRLARETFLFQSAQPGKATVVRGLAFGKSNATSPNFFFSRRGYIGGVLGLGRGRQSLAVQIAGGIRNRFSYCFPPVMDLSPSYLRFGDDIPTTSGAKTTPFAQGGRDPSLYNVALIDLSFNGRRMRFDPHDFGAGGCAIDSGATFTNLPRRRVYSRVEGVMGDYFGRFPNLRRIKDSRGPHGLEMCYSFVGTFDAFPTMSFHFAAVGGRGEVELLLPRDRLFVLLPNKFCLGLGAWDVDISVIGAMQQANLQLTYDLGTQQLRFADARCARA